MRIVGCEILHCNAGWRDFSFLKLLTDENITGISEYNECYGSPGLSGIIRRLVERVKDMDPLAHEHIHQCLYAATRQAPGGVNQQAIAAIENALLDIKGQALNIPFTIFWAVLFGKKYRYTGAIAEHIYGAPKLQSYVG